MFSIREKGNKGANVRVLEGPLHTSRAGELVRSPFWLVLAALAALSGCSATSLMVENPVTKDTAKCEVIGLSASLVQQAAEYCAAAYEKHGWVRITS